jgi:hypothetical protein
MHDLAAAADTIRVAEEAGFRRRAAVRHSTVSGEELDFWEFVRP